jgi:hypothetical protein
MDSSGEKDWDSLVDEMEQIRGRVEKTLGASGEALESGAEDSPKESGISEGHAPSEDYASMDEMLSGLGREEIEADAGKGLALGGASQGGPEGVRDNVVRLESQRASAVETAAAPESALTLAVVGALKLKLELTRESQTVEIHLEESQLRVELSDGTQFRIPLKKAA